MEPPRTIYGDVAEPAVVELTRNGLKLYHNPDDTMGIDLEHAAVAAHLEHVETVGWFLTLGLLVVPDVLVDLQGVRIEAAGLDKVTAEGIEQAWLAGGAASSPGDRVLAYIHQAAGRPQSEG